MSDSEAMREARKLWQSKLPNAESNPEKTTVSNRNSLTSTPTIDQVWFINPPELSTADKSFLMVNNNDSGLPNYTFGQFLNYGSTIEDKSISPTSSISAQMSDLNLLNDTTTYLFANANSTNAADSFKINSPIMLPSSSTPHEQSSLNNLLEPTEDSIPINQQICLSNLHLDSSNANEERLRMAALNTSLNQIELNNLLNNFKNQVSRNNLSSSVNHSLNDDVNGIFRNRTNAMRCRQQLNYSSCFSSNVGAVGDSFSYTASAPSLPRYSPISPPRYSPTSSSRYSPASSPRCNSISPPRNEFECVKSQPDWKALSPSKVDYESFKKSISANPLPSSSSNGQQGWSFLQNHNQTTASNSSMYSTPVKDDTGYGNNVTSPTEQQKNIANSSAITCFSTSSIDWGREPLLESILELMFGPIDLSDPMQAECRKKRSELIIGIKDKFKAKLRSKIVNGKTLEMPVWKGKLSTKHVQNPIFSTKVFLGGVPFDVDSKIPEAFAQFGNVRVQRPKDYGGNQKCGHLYVIFESEESVKAFLDSCEKEIENGKLKYFTNLSSPSLKIRRTEIKPWIKENAIWKHEEYRTSSSSLTTNRTVFIGGLHGTMTAEQIAEVFGRIFGEVHYVNLDTDRYDYPGGSCRLVFKSIKSYILAILAEYVEIDAGFVKKIQINPYISGSKCIGCGQSGTVYCCNLECLNNYCQACFKRYHNGINHRSITKKINESK